MAPVLEREGATTSPAVFRFRGGSFFLFEQVRGGWDRSGVSSTTAAQGGMSLERAMGPGGGPTNKKHFPVR